MEIPAFVDVFPIEKKVNFHCYVSLLEGNPTSFVSPTDFRHPTLPTAEVLPGSALVALALEVASKILQSDTVQLQDVGSEPTNQQKHRHFLVFWCEVLGHIVVVYYIYIYTLYIRIIILY